VTGPEHYREAELLLESIAEFESGSKEEASRLAEAQVHATLAIAAAVGLATKEVPKTSRTGKRHRLTREHLEAVASVYTEALAEGEPPTRAVADHFDATHSTAAKWVTHARKAGLLSVTTPGRSAS